MTHYSIVVERETNGTFSAWVAGLPGVYAAADTVRAAKAAIRSALTAHLETLAEHGQTAAPHADVAVLRVDEQTKAGRFHLKYVGLGALLGRHTSAKKTAAARRNGLKGGRPRKLVPA
ncbi:MAG TPA: type II toxin-antitoxin system HicB family antitoxin [Vicinamibacterales bacterium]|jgi:predicted RNase H-like HicB family nuclease|nr:type II toxin-antitoxin system HicB family antitoxin [Vicinamibacterales bacterium]